MVFAVRQAVDVRIFRRGLDRLPGRVRDGDLCAGRCDVEGHGEGLNAEVDVDALALAIYGDGIAVRAVFQHEDAGLRRGLAFDGDSRALGRDEGHNGLCGRILPVQGQLAVAARGERAAEQADQALAAKFFSRNKRGFVIICRVAADGRCAAASQGIAAADRGGHSIFAAHKRAAVDLACYRAAVQAGRNSAVGAIIQLSSDAADSLRDTLVTSLSCARNCTCIIAIRDLAARISDDAADLRGSTSNLAGVIASSDGNRCCCRNTAD